MSEERCLFVKGCQDPAQSLPRTSGSPLTSRVDVARAAFDEWKEREGERENALSLARYIQAAFVARLATAAAHSHCFARKHRHHMQFPPARSWLRNVQRPARCRRRMTIPVKEGGVRGTSDSSRIVGIKNELLDEIISCPRFDEDCTVAKSSRRAVILKK